MAQRSCVAIKVGMMQQPALYQVRAIQDLDPIREVEEVSSRLQPVSGSCNAHHFRLDCSCASARHYTLGQ